MIRTSKLECQVLPCCLFLRSDRWLRRATIFRPCHFDPFGNRICIRVLCHRNPLYWMAASLINFPTQKNDPETPIFYQGKLWLRIFNRFLNPSKIDPTIFAGNPSGRIALTCSIASSAFERISSNDFSTRDLSIEAISAVSIKWRGMIVETP